MLGDRGQGCYVPALYLLYAPECETIEANPRGATEEGEGGKTAREAEEERRPRGAVVLNDGAPQTL